MTAPDLLAALESVIGTLPAAPRVWDEGLEARIDQVAASWDAETRSYRRLGPRRDR